MFVCVFHRRAFALVFVRCGLLCGLRFGINMLWRGLGRGLEVIVELHRFEALSELPSDGGIIHIQGVTIGIIICPTIVIIIIHNIGVCGSIPSRNWAVVVVVIELILCAIPYEEGCCWNNGMGMCWLCFCLEFCGASNIIIIIKCGSFCSCSFCCGFARCLCGIMHGGWGRKRKPRLLLAIEALVVNYCAIILVIVVVVVVVVVIGRVIIVIIGCIKGGVRCGLN